MAARLLPLSEPAQPLFPLIAAAFYVSTAPDGKVRVSRARTPSGVKYALGAPPGPLAGHASLAAHVAAALPTLASAPPGTDAGCGDEAVAAAALVMQHEHYQAQLARQARLAGGRGNAARAEPLLLPLPVLAHGASAAAARAQRTVDGAPPAIEAPLSKPLLHGVTQLVLRYQAGFQPRLAAAVWSELQALRGLLPAQAPQARTLASLLYHLARSRLLCRVRPIDAQHCRHVYLVFAI